MSDIEQFTKELNCTYNEVIDFSSNINFVKPHINFDFEDFEITSYLNYDKLYDMVTKLYEVKKNEIEFFNGTSSARFSLFKHLNLQKCFIYAPASIEYKKIATLFGYEMILINRFDSMDDSQVFDENSLIILTNPSIPDGLYYPLEHLFQKLIKANSTILIDESFLDFTNKKSAIEFIKCYPKLYILKSLTPFYGDIGIRIGAIISNKIAIANLKQTEPFWKISQFDSQFIIQALSDKNFKKIAKALNAKNNSLLEMILHNSNLFEKIYPSDGNFILGKLKNIKGLTLQNYLLNYKIYIKDCSNFDFLDDSYVKFAVKSTKDLEILEKALKNYNTKI
ncbi:MAG: aminotransferase class I/II-fold pyridoxal phosphate-dependent enzyme [Epsilonproteobacteria bacterium]|nr:aminotransferase class I/II-fold pyridoxal phosphate-dependent enzyme [Campylobacterota bacterium]